MGSDAVPEEALLAGAETWMRYVRKRGGGNLEHEFQHLDLRKIPDFPKGYKFDRRVVFRDCQFGSLVANNLNEEFSSSAVFINCTVAGRAYFGAPSGHKGPGTLSFDNVAFDDESHPVHFGHLDKSLTIKSCRFRGGLGIAGSYSTEIVCGGIPDAPTYIHGELTCATANFGAGVSFTHVQVVKSTTGNGGVDFRNAKFFAAAELSNMRIEGSARFDKAEFNDRTTFRNTRFLEAPSFHEAKLHRETTFDPVELFDKQFPDVRTEGATARYRTLKDLMAQHQALGEQLGFARLEMKAHAASLGGVNLYQFYGLFADYGLSWARPLMWWMALTVVGAGAYIVYDGTCDPEHYSALLALALSNAAPFIGSLKALSFADIGAIFTEPRDHVVIAVASFLQSVASGILLFLIALGLRNRLRMK